MPKSSDFPDYSLVSNWKALRYILRTLFYSDICIFLINLVTVKFNVVFYNRIQMSYYNFYRRPIVKLLKLRVV